MTLTHSDWREIQKEVNRLIAQVGEPFVQGEVVKNDQANRLVWLKEFGDQPIPMISFDYQVKYYYQNPAGNMVPRTTKAHTKEVEILVPRIGEIVLVARHMGSRRLPKCLGVIKSTDYVRAGGEE